MMPQLLARARTAAAIASDRVPIWLSFSRRQLQHCLSIANWILKSEIRHLGYEEEQRVESLQLVLSYLSELVTVKSSL